MSLSVCPSILCQQLWKGWPASTELERACSANEGSGKIHGGKPQSDPTLLGPIPCNVIQPQPEAQEEPPGTETWKTGLLLPRELQTGSCLLFLQAGNSLTAPGGCGCCILWPSASILDWLGCQRHTNSSWSRKSPCWFSQCTWKASEEPGGLANPPSPAGCAAKMPPGAISTALGGHIHSLYCSFPA